MWIRSIFLNCCQQSNRTTAFLRDVQMSSSPEIIIISFDVFVFDAFNPLHVKGFMKISCHFAITIYTHSRTDYLGWENIPLGFVWWKNTFHFPHLLLLVFLVVVGSFGGGCHPHAYGSIWRLYINSYLFVEVILRHKIWFFFALSKHIGRKKRDVKEIRQIPIFVQKGLVLSLNVADYNWIISFFMLKRKREREKKVLSMPIYTHTHTHTMEFLSFSRIIMLPRRVFSMRMRRSFVTAVQSVRHIKNEKICAMWTQHILSLFLFTFEHTHTHTQEDENLFTKPSNDSRDENPTSSSSPTPRRRKMILSKQESHFKFKWFWIYFSLLVWLLIPLECRQLGAVKWYLERILLFLGRKKTRHYFFGRAKKKTKFPTIIKFC